MYGPYAVLGLTDKLLIVGPRSWHLSIPNQPRPYSVCAAGFGIFGMYLPSLAEVGKPTVSAGQVTARFHIVRTLVWAGFGITALSYGPF